MPAFMNPNGYAIHLVREMVCGVFDGAACEERLRMSRRREPRQCFFNYAYEEDEPGMCKKISDPAKKAECETS